MRNWNFLSIAKMHLDIAYLEFVKVHLNTLSYLEMIWNLEENFYDFVLWYIYDASGQRNLWIWGQYQTSVTAGLVLVLIVCILAH